MITIENFSDIYPLAYELLVNVIIDSDSYKTSHWKQYPPDTQYIVSYLESRGGRFAKTRQFGFQYIIKNQFCGITVTHEMIDVAKFIIVQHMGGIPEYFNESGWRYIVDHCGGKLPISIKIIPEGYLVEVHNALAVMTNTDPHCYWLVNYLETAFHRVWYPITVCTLSSEIRQVILEFLTKSGTPELIDFMLQDFGSRGVSCREEAMIGAAAHAVNFRGSDTMIAIPMLMKYYNASKMPLFSVPASEHSTMTSWGKDNEVDAVENMLDSYPSGIVSIVGDSFDIYNFCKVILGQKLYKKVINRRGVVVVRPDSGEPCEVVPKLLEILSDAFGYETNEKGYKILPHFIRILQGDGMNFHTLRRLCVTITDLGWSLDNMACFGMGGKLLRGVDRDTQKFAFKCCAINRDGEWFEVYKDPITDPGKTSIRGIPYVTYRFGSGFKTHTTLDPTPQYGNRLVEIYRDGEMIKETTFDEVLKNAALEDYSILVSDKYGK
jgi:nicotinamide phosphoribosyltransferase